MESYPAGAPTDPAASEAPIGHAATETAMAAEAADAMESAAAGAPAEPAASEAPIGHAATETAMAAEAADVWSPPRPPRSPGRPRLLPASRPPGRGGPAAAHPWGKRGRPSPTMES